MFGLEHRQRDGAVATAFFLTLALREPDISGNDDFWHFSVHTQQCKGYWKYFFFENFYKSGAPSGHLGAVAPMRGLRKRKKKQKLTEVLEKWSII